MSFPFGGHPTFQKFLEFAEANGCVLKIVIRETKSGRAYEAYELRNPRGGRLVVPNPDLQERLVPSIVSQYQRRLGIKTPFATLPEPSSPAADYVSVEDSKDN